MNPRPRMHPGMQNTRPQSLRRGERGEAWVTAVHTHLVRVVRLLLSLPLASGVTAVTLFDNCPLLGQCLTFDGHL